jgi:hypothetical protein
MAAAVECAITVSVTGLGKGTECKDIFTDTTAPEVAIHVEQQQQETADVAEVLNVGAIDTVRGIWVRAITGDIAVDTSYVASFTSEQIVYAGTSRVFTPTGTTWIKNNTALGQVTFEYLAWGTQT